MGFLQESNLLAFKLDSLLACPLASLYAYQLVGFSACPLACLLALKNDKNHHDKKFDSIIY